MITVLTMLFILIGSCALISLIIFKSTKSIKLTLTGFIAALVSTPIFLGTIVSPVIEEKQNGAIVEWCRYNKIEYISHYKVKQNSRGSPFGVNYRVKAKGHDQEIALRAGNWLTGSFGWNIEQSL